MQQYSAYNGDKPYIFISYAHKDTDIVMQIVNQMIIDGYRVWYDEGIKPGTAWDDFIATKINRSGLFLAFVSENYLVSSNCKDELNYSKDHMENILLVYLSNVSLPSGIELRFGRTQAIPAYNYDKKEAFFTKLYSTHNIENFRDGFEPQNIVFPSEEPLSTIVEEPVVSAVYPKENPVTSIPEEPVAPVVNPVVRIPAEESEPESRFDKKIIIAIIIAALLLIALIVTIAILSSKSKDKSSPKTEPTTPMVSDIDSSETTIDENVVVIEPVVSQETSAKTEETTTNSDTSIETEETVETTTEDTYDPYLEDYEGDGMFASYNIKDGEPYYNSEYDVDFYENTGAVYLGYLEGDNYVNGSFHNTDTMSIRIPALNGISKEINVLWFYITDKNTAKYLSSDLCLAPEMVNGEMSYASQIDGSVFESGELEIGTYYVMITNPSDGEVLIVVRCFYTPDSLE